jgi:thiamine biosynthesis lipoprotein
MSGLRRTELIMGTMIALHIADPLPPARLNELAESFFDWMREVDRRFSTYIEDSELCRLDRGELQLAECSSDMRGVLDACAKVWSETNGYFDVYATGRLDPSGYVKGWSAEVASARLAEAGCVNHFINAGGDVRTRGCPEPGANWLIPLRHPWQRDGAYLVLSGNDLAVATSGTYERGFHVIDPRTGKQAEALRSVTVVGPDLALADAYATAGVAMGADGLKWLSELSGYHVAVVTEEGEGFTSPLLPQVPPTSMVEAQSADLTILTSGDP